MRALYKKSKEANFTIMKGNTWQIMCRQNVHWGFLQLQTHDV